MEKVGGLGKELWQQILLNKFLNKWTRLQGKVCDINKMSVIRT